MKNNIVKNALLNACAAALYVVAIASFLFYVPKSFGVADNVLIPIVMLLLLVFSVALMGVLIFGRPILWYLDGKKQEAFSLLAYTLVIFLLITLAALLILILCFAR
jgi:hypothetical protein